MREQFERTERLLGNDAMRILSESRVAVFGIGGVGGHTAEALVRSGIGALDLIDPDTVSVSNLNRQILATYPDVGRLKTEVARERLLHINPALELRTFPLFYLPATSSSIDFANYQYIADAIDTVAGKVSLAVEAKKAGVPLISCMGTGNKLDPTRLEVADLFQTSVCPLARVMRTELRKRGIEHLKVVYSKEEPVRATCVDSNGRRSPGSVAFVPSVAGLIMAGEIIRDLIASL